MHAPILKRRNPAFELLRIISMLMIVSLHFFMHGGVLEATTLATWQDTLFHFFQGIFYVSVNQFILISGYFGIHSTTSGKLFRYYTQILFYSLLTFSISFLCNRQTLSLQNLLYVFTPISSKVYWYASKYFLLLLLAPLLEVFQDRLSVSQHRYTCMLLLAIFSLWPSVIFWQDIGLGNGFDFFWFIVVYLLGAYFRKQSTLPPKKSRHPACLAGIFLLSCLSMPLFRLFFYRIDLSVGFDFYYRYNSPPVVISSICFFLLFSGLSVPVRLQKPICLFAPLSFGVYLLHDSSFSKALLWEFVDAARFLTDSSWKTLVYMLLVSIILFFAGSMAEAIRRRLYRLFGGQRMEACLDGLFQKYITSVPAPDQKNHV